MAALDREHHELVLVEVGKGVRLPAVVQERQRQGLRAFEPVVGGREADVDVVALGLVADLAEELRDPARVVLGPAVVLGDVAGDVVVPGARHASLLDLQGEAAERPARELDRATGKLAPALRVDREGAAQRVEPEQRVRAGDELDAGDRRLRQQIPVDDIAERLVDAHAVLEHRQPLGHADEGRGREPAEADVGLVGISLGGIDGDAGRVVLEEFREASRSLLAEVLAAVNLDVGGNVLQRGAEARKRRRPDHLDAL